MGTQTAHSSLAAPARSYHQSQVSSVRGGPHVQPGHRPPVQPYASGPTPVGVSLDPNHQRESGSQKVKEENQDPIKKDIKEEGEEPEAAGDEKAVGPRKKNMWWLKKKRRRRSRLTYIKAKYKKKEDEGPSNAASAVGELEMIPTSSRTPVAASTSVSETMASPRSEPGAKIADQQPLYKPVPRPLKPVVSERPKRGRPPKGLISSKLKAEGDLSDAMDFDDPDWDAGMEGEKRRGKIVKRRRRVKRSEC